MEKEITQKIKGEGPSKIEDFSVPVLSHGGVSVCIFWDLEDFPVPVAVASSPDLIYEKILEVLIELGFMEGIASIWAYVDKDNKSWANFLGNKTWNSRIYFVAAGDKLARVNRMSVDVLLCHRDLMEYCPPNLFVVSHEIISNPIHSFFHSVLDDMTGAHVILYIGSAKDYDPENSDWPRDIFYGEWEGFFTKRMRELGGSSRASTKRMRELDGCGSSRD